jgi:hypothetical protein
MSQKELTAADVLRRSEDPLPQEVVEVPEWGGAVRVRMLTAAEREAWELSNAGKGGARNPGARGRLVAACACRADGELIFKPDNAGQIDGLGARPVERLFDACLRINGLTPDAQEEARKNSSAPPSGASSSDSPPPSA